MGVIRYDPDGHVMEGSYRVLNAQCFHCGSSQPTGVWIAEPVVATCRKCAVEILPRLIADAIAGTCHGVTSIQKEIDDEEDGICEEMSRTAAIQVLNQIDRIRMGKDQ